MPRLSAVLYFAYFAAAGIAVTYWPYHMEALGLDDADIGTVFGVRTAIAIASQLALIAISPKLRRNGLLLLTLAAWTLLTAIAMPFASTGVLLAALFWAQSPSQATLVPVLDTMVVTAVGAIAYGRYRRWGSLGYGAGVATFGLLTEHLSHSRAGELSIPTFAMLAGLVLVAAFALRGETAIAHHEPPSLLRLAATPGLLPFLAFNAVHWAAITVFNVFFPLHTKALGLGNATPGIAVLVAVLAEFVAFWAAGRLLQTRSATFWLVIVTLTSALRWVGTALVPDSNALIALQALHFFSFGIWLSAVMDILGRFGAPAERGSLQAMLFAAVFGLGGILGSVGGGWLMKWDGGRAAFLGAAAAEVLALIGLVLSRPRWRQTAATAHA